MGARRNGGSSGLLARIAALLRGPARREQRSAEAAGGVIGGEAAGIVRDMGWQNFEILVAEGFRLQGFSVTHAGGGYEDGGVDLVLARGQEKFLVQCKPWRAQQVSVGVIEELHQAMTERGAAGGFVVTSGEFTGDAMAFAANRNIELISGPKLLAMLEKAKTTVTGSMPLHWGLRFEHPSCPLCRRGMVKRVVDSGVNAGKQIWGCPAFPSCRGTLPIG